MQTITDASSINLNHFLAIAEEAGKNAGQGRQDSLAELILNDTLGDDEREKLGFATEMLSRAKQAGQMPAEIWNTIQYAMGADTGKPLELHDLDTVELGVLAFGGGVCAEDETVHTSISQYVSAALHGRSLAEGMRVG